MPTNKAKKTNEKNIIPREREQKIQKKHCANASTTLFDYEPGQHLVILVFLNFFPFQTILIALLCAQFSVCVCMCRENIKNVLQTHGPSGKLHVCKKENKKMRNKHLKPFPQKDRCHSSFFHLIIMLTFKSLCALSYSGWVRFWTIKWFFACWLLLQTFFLSLFSNKGSIYVNLIRLG